MTAPSVTRPQARRVSASTFMLIAAWVVASLEGYDLAVYGVTVPAILGDPSLGIDKAEAGTIGSLVGIGMLIGAALAGALVHRTGPRLLLLVGTSVFSLGMAVCTVAAWRPVLRGRTPGRRPRPGRRTADDQRVRRRPQRAGPPQPQRRPDHERLRGRGPVLPLLGTALLPDISYRWLYVIGVIPVFLAIPLVLRLPESPFHLSRTGRTAEARAVEEQLGLAPSDASPTSDPGRWLGIGSLLTGGLAVSTVLFWAMSFCGLLLVFGISTWLPSIMQAAGFSSARRCCRRPPCGWVSASGPSSAAVSRTRWAPSVWWSSRSWSAR